MEGEFAASVDIDELAAALSKAQAALPNPPRNRTVTVRTKKGGSYEFSYATLDVILELAKKPLADNGLAVVQLPMASAVETPLLHSSGQWLSASTPIRVDGSDAQAYGSAVTYARRYALTAMLGIAADEDDDGNAASDNVVEKSTDYGDLLNEFLIQQCGCVEPDAKSKAEAVLVYATSYKTIEGARSEPEQALRELQAKAEESPPGKWLEGIGV